jgi:type II secretory pathway pseudopilin PulG
MTREAGHEIMSTTRKRRRAFTLVEVIVSTVSASVLLVSFTATLFISSRAFNNNSRSVVRRAAAANVMADITADLHQAIRFTERTTPNAVTFTVPDRNGDAVPDTIRYAWSGVPGASLTYSFNGGTAVPVVDNVQNFNLAYLTRRMGPDPPPPSNESAEMLLKSHDDAPGGNFYSFQLTSGLSTGVYFFPNLPAGTQSWRVTRIRLRARASGNTNGIFKIQMRTADAQLLPTATILDELTAYESSLQPNFTWFEYQFGGLSDLNPTKGLVIVVDPVSGTGQLANFEYEDDIANTPNTHWLKYNGGQGWQVQTGEMRFEVYGTVTTTQ